jgi:glutamate 5-kinase
MTLVITKTSSGPDRSDAFVEHAHSHLAPSAWSAIAVAQRIVIKVGTNVVMRDDGQVSIARIYALAESIAALRRAGRSVVLVSSGAIGLGVQRLGIAERPQSLPLKQACAAIGQGRLMALYADAFDRFGVVSAQVLVTEDDLAMPERYYNLRATLDTLLEIGAVPIVNENDTVSTVELERMDGAGVVVASGSVREPIFGDNDKLSALIATKIEARVLLSDVDGLFTGNPATVSGATLVRVVSEVTPALLASASGSGTRGRGGMATKLQAARIAISAGTYVVIANGRASGIIESVCAGSPAGTLFIPKGGTS